MAAGGLIMLGVTAAPAQAAFDPDARTGYTKVVEKEAYLRNITAQGFEVLHVDTEHAAVDGFWFAVKSGMSPRGFEWRHQTYGVWCGGTTQQVEWNGWMNTTRCGIDFAKAESEAPGITANTQACRANTGHPWKTGFGAPNTACDDVLLSAIGSGTFQEAGTNYQCAPWEEQGLSTSGASKCLTQRYDWESTAPNSFWMPAPDTCTGMPANSNRVYTEPAAYVPAGPVPDCTGAALANNCPVGSTHQACTGVPETVNWATATITSTVTDGTGTATVTKVAEHTAVVYKVTRTAKATYKGKVYKAKKTVKVHGKATRGVTVTVTVTDGRGTRTSTMSCAAGSAGVAQACADAKAGAEANRAARVAANDDASARAKIPATAQAAEQAAEAAERGAESSVSKSARKAAAKKAMKQAKKAVAKAVAKAKKRDR